MAALDAADGLPSDAASDCFVGNLDSYLVEVPLFLRLPRFFRAATVRERSHPSLTVAVLKAHLFCYAKRSGYAAVALCGCRGGHRDRLEGGANNLSTASVKEIDPAGRPAFESSSSASPSAHDLPENQS